jgi:hypothetical protein
MSDPLDDFNRRMTAGGSSWTMGPARNVAESAAQSFLDAQQRPATSKGGGSIDFGARTGALLLLLGLLLFPAGGYMLEHTKEASAMTGVLVLLVSGFLLLIGGGGLAVALIQELGTASGVRILLLAVAAGAVMYWLTPRLGYSVGMRLPGWSMGLGAAALVILADGGRGLRRRG